MHKFLASFDVLIHLRDDELCCKLIKAFYSFLFFLLYHYIDHIIYQTYNYNLPKTKYHSNHLQKTDIEIF